MFKKTIIFSVVFLISLQFIQVTQTNPKVDENIALHTSKDVMKILKKGCYDCHSYNTNWPSYSKIAPISFFVTSHVNDARAALNFSKWDEIDNNIKKLRLKRAIVTVKNGRMALPSYLSMHKEAVLSQTEKKVLLKWFQKELSKIKENK